MPVNRCDRAREARTLQVSVLTHGQWGGLDIASVQSSTPESPVVSPRGEAATALVRFSNAVPVPPGQTARWQQYPAEELDDWEEEVDLETFLAGESDWIHRNVLDSDTLDSYVEEECSADKSLYEAYLGYKEARGTLNQVPRGRGFWP